MPGLFDNSSVPGLLSPQEQDFARQQGMMTAAAALMNGARYSAVPVSPFETLGSALQGYTQGYNGASDQLLKREQLRGTIDARKLSALSAIASYRAAGLPVPPLLQQMVGGAGAMGADPTGGAVPGASGAPSGTGLPAPGSGMPPAGGGAPAAGGGMPPQNSGAPALPPGLLSPTPTAQTPAMGMPQAQAASAPQASAAPPAPPSIAGGVSGAIRNLPIQDRFALVAPGSAGKIVQKVVGDNLTQTPDQKNAAASGMSSPFAYKVGVKNAQLAPDQKSALDAGFKTASGAPDVAAYQADLAARKGVGEAKAKRIGEIIEAGGSAARDTLNSLNVMEDAVNAAGDNLTTGPFGNEMMKVKQALQSAGIPQPGLAETETLSKFNTWLAGQAIKTISSRPSQLEFQNFLKANPGLLTSSGGTKALINIMRQTTQQKIGLSRLAMDDKNIKNWGDVEDKFYKDPANAIVSPFTGQPLGTAAGGGNVTPAAAPVYTKTATNKAGQRLGLDPKTNQWVPIK